MKEEGLQSKIDQTWVYEILKEDNLQLTNEEQQKPFGRAELSANTKKLLLLMRIYVIGTSLIVVGQLIISLRQ